MNRFGLCDTCVNAKLIRNTRGSVFLMCKLALRNSALRNSEKADERFVKYPPAPITNCPGYAPPAETSDR